MNNLVNPDWSKLKQINDILGPPTLLPNASNFVTLNVDENDPIELQCPVTNTPDLSIQWSKNNEDLEPIWSSTNLLIKRFLLKIPKVQSTDGGLYKCNVVNGFGSVQVQFRINVKCKLSFEASNLQINSI